MSATDKGVAAEYRYFTTDLLTNSILAEIPFSDVSYERVIKAAGPFSGTIAVIPDNAHMNLYESTMPGKTGLYVVRDSVCVWGGIIWSRSYDVVERTLTVQGSEFPSYFYHRNIWKTWSHDFGANVVASGGTLTVTLQTQTYPFATGDPIKIEFLTTDMYTYNGYYTVASSSAEDTFTVTGTSVPDGTYIDATVYIRVDTYDYVRQLVEEVMADFNQVRFPNGDIEPALTNKIAASNKLVSSGVATITTSTPHGIIPSQTVDLYNVDSTLDGLQDVTSTPTSTTFTFATTAGDISSTAITVNTKTVTHKQITKVINSNETISFVGTLTTSASHGFSVGDTVEISGVDGIQVSITNKSLTGNIATITTSTPHQANLGDYIEVTGVDSTFNGVYYIEDIPSPTTLKYAKAASDVPSTAVSPAGTLTVKLTYAIFDGTMTVIEVPSTTTFTVDVYGSELATAPVISGATAVKTPTVLVGTYGAFPGNSDVDIYFSTDAYSGSNVPNTSYRGYELRSVGEELDAYSDTVDGFEYRVDCHIEYVDDVPVFTREFVLIPIDFPDPPAAGEVSPLSRFGADSLVFEYPGNILSMNMEENAENAATRFFVVGNIPDLGEDASQPYAVATATDLLQDGWPLLDQEETRSEVQDEELLYAHAQRYLAESRAPISDISVTVNGSLSPTIGEYVPGDWCAITVNDEFVRMRLASDLEPRDTVIVRKIDGFKVRVPNAPSFPEEVTLTLVTEPEVDAIGQ